ncbi:PCMD domain-containing protein [Bacteroides sp.]
MKLKNLIACFFLGFIATSCIKDEAPNAEADIETCTVPGDVLNREPIIENERITLILKKGTDITALAPKFTLTPGATMVPESGSVLDFTNPQYYEVTSEDRKWKKKYKVEVSFSGITNTVYHFENARLDKNGQYTIFYETDTQGKETMLWASGNPGYAMTGVQGGSDIYPTYQSTDGYQGKCLTLTTRKTGWLGNSVNMPIAAGNLFIGTFDVLNALKDALTATKFGSPFEYIPTYMKGYYKFTAGDTFYVLDENNKEDKLKPVPGKKDICDIYAVFYEPTNDMKTLNGANVLSEDNPNIISIARISDAKETREWTAFNLPFVYREGKTIDPAKLKDGKYNLAIVFSSSIDGAYFEGAPGSTLYIDEVELGYEE